MNGYLRRVVDLLRALRLEVDLERLRLLRRLVLRVRLRAEPLRLRALRDPLRLRATRAGDLLLLLLRARALRREDGDIRLLVANVQRHVPPCARRDWYN